MISFRRSLVTASLILTSALPCAAMTHTRRGPTAPRLFTRKAKTTKAVRSSGQQTIGGDRATQIQAALIKQGYLSGEASGHWDSPTEAAMQKLQADNGWQTKLVPDSRAIIKLGLGPAQASQSSASAISSTF